MSRLREICTACYHLEHQGECGAPITHTIRDDVGYGGVRPTGQTRTLIVATCNCSRFSLAELYRIREEKWRDVPACPDHYPSPCACDGDDHGEDA